MEKGFSRMEKGFDLMEKSFASTADELIDIQRDMATKKELEAFRSESNQNFAELRSEVSEIHKQITALEEQGASHAGFAKEIDYLLARVARIEKHLGMSERKNVSV